MEKRVTTAAGGGGGLLIERLPHSLLLEILTRLDFESLCSAAPVCTVFNTLVSQALSSITILDLSGFTLDVHILHRILRDNESLRSLTLDCRRLDDSSVKIFAKDHLHELVLVKCQLFSTSVLTAVGEACPNLRIFMMEVICSPDLESSRDWKRNITTGLLKTCLHLETLWIKFPDLAASIEDIVIIEFLPKTLKVLLLQPVSEHQAKACLLKAGCSGNMTASATRSDMPNYLGPMNFHLQSLSLVLDNITDELLSIIVDNLHLLTQLCLEDRPIEKPQRRRDLTNDGIQLLGSYNHLTSLSLTRRSSTYFKRVNDVGILFLAENCRNLESIRFSGFSRVTDAGYRSILHSCRKLRKLEIVDAFSLTDLAFYGISDASCSLVELKLISCSLLTSFTANSLHFFENLEVLDFSGCKSIGDEGLVSISKLCNLTKLDFGSADVTDIGLSALGSGKSPIVSLNIRGCNGVNDLGVSSLLLEHGVISLTLSSLDLGNMAGVTDGSIYTIAKVCKVLRELCLRGCFHITDVSIAALGSANDVKGKKHSLQKLDLYHCTGLSHKSYQLLMGTSFCSLHWLGVCETSFAYRCERQSPELVKRPWLFICISGCEMGCRDGWRFHQYYLYPT